MPAHEHGRDHAAFIDDAWDPVGAAGVGVTHADAGPAHATAGHVLGAYQNV